MVTVGNEAERFVERRAFERDVREREFGVVRDESSLRIAFHVLFISNYGKVRFQNSLSSRASRGTGKNPKTRAVEVGVARRRRKTQNRRYNDDGCHSSRIGMESSSTSKTTGRVQNGGKQRNCQTACPSQAAKTSSRVVGRIPKERHHQAHATGKVGHGVGCRRVGPRTPVRTTKVPYSVQ